MASAPGRTADDISTNIKALVDRVLEAEVTDKIAETGRDVATAVAEATSSAAERAAGAWKESAPARRDAAKAVRGARKDAGRWTDRTWRRQLRPALRDLWSQRGVAIGAAGAALPASREIVDSAAVRLGLKKREERHWGSFFLGFVIGAIAGAVIAILTAPKPGREMRDELATRAREAGEWVPVFQRSEVGQAAAGGGNGAPTTYSSEFVTPQPAEPTTPTSVDTFGTGDAAQPSSSGAAGQTGSEPARARSRGTSTRATGSRSRAAGSDATTDTGAGTTSLAGDEAPITAPETAEEPPR